ncbi:hypothetical protein T439DRAFT_325236 [Meredithblackwellia eburnea MCA 4105]
MLQEAVLLVMLLVGSKAQTFPYEPPRAELPDGASAVVNIFLDNALCSFNFPGMPFAGFPDPPDGELYCYDIESLPGDDFTTCPGTDGQALVTRIISKDGSGTTISSCTLPRDCPVRGCTKNFITAQISTILCSPGTSLVAHSDNSGCACLAPGATDDYPICSPPANGVGICNEYDTNTSDGDFFVSTNCGISCNAGFTPTPSASPISCCPNELVVGGDCDQVGPVGPSQRAKKQRRATPDITRGNAHAARARRNLEQEI